MLENESGLLEISKKCMRSVMYSNSSCFNWFQNTSSGKLLAFLLQWNWNILHPLYTTFISHRQPPTTVLYVTKTPTYATLYTVSHVPMDCILTTMARSMGEMINYEMRLAIFCIFVTDTKFNWKTKTISVLVRFSILSDFPTLSVTLMSHACWFLLRTKIFWKGWWIYTFIFKKG